MKLLIDGREIEAHEGETVLQVAHRHGIDIPHFCWHEKLSVAGSCRMCLVKVNGLAKLMPACGLAVVPKMRIETQVEEVERARREVMQFLLLNHPVDCGICDKAGECSLQDNEIRYGPSRPRSLEPKRHRRKLYPLSPRISLDNERCILCSRCVRFTREISGSNALGIVQRGVRSMVDRLDDKPFDDPYSDNVIGICPTGALLSTDFLYQSRVWFLEPVRSVCNGCARGCSVNVWRRKRGREPHMPGAASGPRAYRVTAFENPEINGPWLCNKGFDLHQRMARDRLLQPLVAGRPASWDEALAAARRLVADARNPAALVSTHGSNEELDAFRSLLANRFRTYAHEDCVPEPGEVVDDRLLIRADKNPNGFGVQTRFGAAALPPVSNHDVVLVWGELGDGAASRLGAARVIHLTAFGPAAAARAAVALPLSTHFERAGTFTNFEGKANAFAPVFDPPPGVRHAVHVFRSLAG
jgi:NADH-quinone oxidoreductase subunit G